MGIHNESLAAVKKRITENNILMYWDKCEIGRSQVTFIGKTLTAVGISPSKEKVMAILQICRAMNKEVQRAMGCINDMEKYLPNLTAKCSNLFRI